MAFTTTATFPGDWTDREQRMLKLIVQLAIGQTTSSVAWRELRANVVALEARSVEAATPASEAANLSDARLTAAYSAAVQQAADMVKSVFPEVEIVARFEP